MVKLPLSRPLSHQPYQAKKDNPRQYSSLPGYYSTAYTASFFGLSGRKARGGWQEMGYIRVHKVQISDNFGSLYHGWARTLVIDGDIIQTYCRTVVDAIKRTISRDFLLLIFFHKTA
jgi:hypothetical protein